MNRRSLKILAALSLGIPSIMAREIRTPEPLYRGYAFSHYPFARLDYEDCKDECKCWYVDIWGAGLYKHANRAFTNKDSTKTGPLAGLFFCQDAFSVAQSFSPTTPLPVPSDPLLGILLLTPSFDYTERVAFFGANVETIFGCDNEWHVGLRVRIPYRDTQASLDSCCALEESIVDLFALDNERWSCPACDPVPVGSEQTVFDVFAIRLDLASALLMQQSGSAPFIPTKLVVYGDGTTAPAPNGDTRINGADVSNVVSGQTGIPETPVYLIESDGGFQPIPPFALPQPTVRALPVLPANGAGSGTGSKFVFGTGVDYAAGIGANPAAQRNYWLAPAINTVPTAIVDADGAAPLGLVDDAYQIANSLKQLLQYHSINNGLSPVNFLLSNTISFDTARRNGAGNLDLELYTRYDGCFCCGGNWFAEGIIGARFPTDKRVRTPGQLLLVPTGNNHHYEIDIGGYFGWQPNEWFALKADAWYFWALRGRERVNAPFVGATVCNIGPQIDANVSWGYFVGDIDFTFLVPCACDFVGFNIGYQIWAKQKDHVRFDVTTALDFFGVPQLLDPSLLECHTNRIAHTVKAEIFKQLCDWQLFAGFNYNFAGKNALQDANWYLGLEVYF